MFLCVPMCSYVFLCVPMCSYVVLCVHMLSYSFLVHLMSHKNTHNFEKGASDLHIFRRPLKMGRAKKWCHFLAANLSQKCDAALCGVTFLNPNLWPENGTTFCPAPFFRVFEKYGGRRPFFSKLCLFYCFHILSFYN